MEDETCRQILSNVVLLSKYQQNYMYIGVQLGDSHSLSMCFPIAILWYNDRSLCLKTI